jgi:predicted TIM-barrel fold metal-dependent hydrolase
MGHAAELAAEQPSIVFVLQHAGMLEDLSAAGRAAWRGGMAKLASCPNVVSKLSAFGTFIHRNDPAFIAEVIRDTVALFGSERCLFGSNFPIEKLWTDYPSLIAAHRAAVAHLPQPDQANIFGNTARRVYRL